jgi:hypothetical protein
VIPSSPMRCERHGLALGPEGTCVLCRREASSTPITAPPEARPRSRAVPLLMLLVLLAAGGGVLWRYLLASRADLVAFLPGTVKALQTKNAGGRNGAYFLPSGYEERPLPLLVAIHGTNNKAEVIVNVFREAAEREKFIVVAPESRLTPDGKDSWEVGDHPGEITPDYLHVKAEGLRRRGARAARRAHRPEARAHRRSLGRREHRALRGDQRGAVHGVRGVARGRLRGRAREEERARWFSTGQSDGLRGPKGVQEAASRAKGAGVADVEYRVYPGGHEIGEQELREMLEWWLRG